MASALPNAQGYPYPCPYPIGPHGQTARAQGCAARPHRRPPITSFACTNNTSNGRLALPSQWGDPPARQVPLFVRWEDYAPSFLRDLRRVFVVQAGANCGKNTYKCAAGGDPVWEYATACGWRGVMLEPVSYTFSALCYNYDRWPRITPLRAAVSNVSGTRQISLGSGESFVL